LDIRNAHPGHIGLTTIDVVIEHTQWPCVEHAPEVRCADAVRQASKRPFRTLTPQHTVPKRDFVSPDHR
jgi:hypothetical protein